MKVSSTGLFPFKNTQIIKDLCLGTYADDKLWLSTVSLTPQTIPVDFRVAQAGNQWEAKAIRFGFALGRFRADWNARTAIMRGEPQM